MELYYYTTTQTMQYILQNGDIYATNLRYMNDSEEYINGLEEIYKLMHNRAIVEEWEKSRKYTIREEALNEVFNDETLEQNKRDLDYYSISFCEKNDLLSQWAIYARESGVSIKMNFSKDKYDFAAFSEIEETKGEPQKMWSGIPEKVQYFTYESMKGDNDLYRTRGNEILNKLYKVGEIQEDRDDKKEQWKYISTFVKRYDFFQEAEYRLVFDLKNALDVPRIDYRNDKNVLKPYIDVYCQEGWPIWEIMVGPGFNQEIVYNSIKSFLDHAKIKNQINGLLDYVERVEEYLKPCENFQNNEFFELQELINEIKNDNALDIDNTLIKFCDGIRRMCNSEDLNKEENRKVKQYLQDYYFSRSGIILSKSSIPYIF